MYLQYGLLFQYPWSTSHCTTSLERFTNILISPVKHLNEHNTRYAEIRELWTFVFLLWKLIYKRPN